MFLRGKKPGEASLWNYFTNTFPCCKEIEAGLWNPLFRPIFNTHSKRTALRLYVLQSAQKPDHFWSVGPSKTPTCKDHSKLAPQAGHHSPTHRSTATDGASPDGYSARAPPAAGIQPEQGCVGHGNVYRLVDRTLVCWNLCWNSGLNTFKKVPKTRLNVFFAWKKARRGKSLELFHQHKSCCATDEEKFQRPV